MIKAAFFDIDGTILKIHENRISGRCAAALNTLQENGTKIFLSTGRPLAAVPVFENVRFDGILCFNGQLYCEHGKTVFERSLDPHDVNQIIANIHALPVKKGIVLCNAGGLACDTLDDDLIRYMNHAIERDQKAFSHKKNETLYQIIVGMNHREQEQILKNTSSSKIVYWCEYGLDIIPKEGGKDEGMRKVARLYDIRPDETIAFGDGLNDLPMIRAAGIGVAMENGYDALKQEADFVTKSVEDEGVEFALKHFHLI